MAFTMVFSSDVFVDTEVSDLMEDVGNASAANLGSIYAILGNPTVALYSHLGNFQGQTNLKSVLAVLGVPDTVNKPLYTCLVTDRLDNGTYGLAALDATVDAGFVAGAKSAEIVALDAVVDAGFVAGATAAAITALDAVVDAGFVAGAKEATLATAVTQTSSGESKGTFSYLIAGGEQTIVTIDPAGKRWKLGCPVIDLAAAAQNGTIRVYYKVDGVTYRAIWTDTEGAFVVATDVDCQVLDVGNLIIDNLFKITYQAAVAEAIDIPYEVFYEILEA